MAVLRDNLKEFYFVSPHWDQRSQRLLGTVGFEFEIAERAFDQLFQTCLILTDSEAEKWRITEGDSATLAILSRAFVDHTVRIQKILKSMAKIDGEFWQVCEEFFHNNKSVFALRDSLHHVDSRINQGDGVDDLHPAHGDFSWKKIVPPDKLDCFWITFGPSVVGEFAGPVLSTNCTLKQPIDQLIYRAHGITADQTATFTELSRFMGWSHSHFVKVLEKQLTENGVARDEVTEEKAYVGMHARLRLAGLTVS